MLHWMNLVVTLWITVSVGGVPAEQFHNDHSETGVKTGWIEKGFPYVTCVWRLEEEKDLIAATLSRDNGDDNIVALDIDAKKCCVSPNSQAKAMCKIDDTVVVLEAIVPNPKEGENEVFDCKRTYFDGAYKDKHRKVNLTAYLKQDESEYPWFTISVVLLVVSVAVTVIIFFCVYKNASLRGELKKAKEQSREENRKDDCKSNNMDDTAGNQTSQLL